MEHRVQTAAGISKGNIKFSEKQERVKINGHIELIQRKPGCIGQG